jgi:endonuclease YncB( thermonuclease family)
MIGFVAIITSVAASMHLQGADRIAGPVAADVVEVIDGDTIAVRAHIWPGHIVETRVRLDGVDTPETRRPDCEAEREAGHQAAAFTRVWLSERPSVTLHEVRLGSFAGRVIADMQDANGQSLSDALLEAGLASVYGEDGPRCQTATVSAPTPSRPR